MKQQKTYYERFMNMTDAERAAEVAPFDKEDLRSGKPLSAAQRAQHVRAALGGRPKIGRGHKVVSISIEQGLLQRADKAARQLGLTRAALVAKGLESVLKGAA